MRKKAFFRFVSSSFFYATFFVFSCAYKYNLNQIQLLGYNAVKVYRSKLVQWQKDKLSKILCVIFAIFWIDRTNLGLRLILKDQAETIGIFN